MKKILTVALLGLIAISAAGCMETFGRGRGPVPYTGTDYYGGPGPIADPGRPMPAGYREGYGGDDEERQYAANTAVGGGRYGGSDRPDNCKPIKLPSGRQACVEHITDRKVTHQPQYDMRAERDSMCGGNSGKLVKMNIGDGLVGNYRCP